MALQSILHDPNISKFLDQIPQNQHIITLKQLIYIGIKIVSNSFHSDSIHQNNLTPIQNKQNRTHNTLNPNPNPKSPHQNFYKYTQNDKNLKTNKNHHLHTGSNRSEKIQPSLLRQISKIRLQLESLTNKVYDHYFDENQHNSNHNLIEFNDRKQPDYVQSCGFEYTEDIPTFSPSKPKLGSMNSFASNPFLKQKNNFFVTDNNNKQNQNQRDRGRSHEAKQGRTYPQQQQRCRAKSNLIHLDDTQIRQALYKENEQSETQNFSKNKQKKSHSMIEKKHQQKKKDQQNYFYKLNVDKKNIKELQKFKQFKQQPDASYRDYVDDRPPRIDFFKKKAKSKIKPLVQRDRLKHQTKVQEQSFKKGFEQYEYSANQMDQHDQEQHEQEQSQQSQQEQEESYNKEVGQNRRSVQGYENSLQEEFKRQRNVSNPNFGFYDSKEESQQFSRRQNTFNDNQSFPEKMNINDKQQSFSEFSEFSMSSSNSRRQAGKISRRRQQ